MAKKNPFALDLKYHKPPKLPPPPKIKKTDQGVGEIDITASAIIVPGPVLPVPVGFSKATTPPSQGTDTSGNLIVPVPSGVVDGDRLLAWTVTNSNTAWVPPAGWVPVVSAGGGIVLWERIAAAEPVSYTWVHSATARARSGVMGAIRGGARGDTVMNPSAGAGPTAACPNVTAGVISGALWLGLPALFASDADDDFTVSGIHTLQVQHSSAAFGSVASAISLQTGLSALQTVGAGNLFGDNAVLSWAMAALVIDPV